MAHSRDSFDVLPHSKLREQFGWGAEFEDNDVGLQIWGEWLTPALASALPKCKLDPETIGSGLDQIQEACCAIGKDVSAKKLVVNLL